jgi:hypothetical protein
MWPPMANPESERVTATTQDSLSELQAALKRGRAILHPPYIRRRTMGTRLKRPSDARGHSRSGVTGTSIPADARPVDDEDIWQVAPVPAPESIATDRKSRRSARTWRSSLSR